MRSISCVLVLYILYIFQTDFGEVVVCGLIGVRCVLQCVQSIPVSASGIGAFARQATPGSAGAAKSATKFLRWGRDGQVEVKREAHAMSGCWIMFHTRLFHYRWKKRTPCSTGKNKYILPVEYRGIGLVAAMFGYVWQPGRSVARCLISRQPASSCFPVSLRPKLLWCGSVCCHHCGHNRLCVAIATLLSLDFIHTRQILWRRQWHGSVSWIVMLSATNSQLWSEIVLPDW